MSGASIYLDHNSTTPIDPRVVETMARAWKDCGANPASQHSLGRQARRMLEQAREGILELLGAKTGGMGADQLIFTSGGTEANNLALFGLVALASESAAGDLKPATGNSVALFVSPIEHPSISTPVPVLRKQGCQVISMPVNDRGLVDFSALPEQALAQKPRSVASVMLANNETGVVQPIAEIARQWRERVCGPAAEQLLRAHFFHTDAVQAVGKISIHFRELGVDAMTVAPHKFHGPLGIGALILRHAIKPRPRLFGGFQQGGLRPGTENVALAVGFHEALKIVIDELPDRAARMQSLRDELEKALRAELPELVIVGEQAPLLPNTSCLSFPGLDRQALVIALDLARVACSTGSACASGSSEPSPTLVAMGLPKALIEGAIRLSLGAFTTAEEVAEAARRIIKTVKHLRSQK